jgi:hypothetical protein
MSSEAIRDWDRSIALDDGFNETVRLFRSVSLAHLGEHAKAVVAVEELLRSSQLHRVTVFREGAWRVILKRGPAPGLLYNSACVYAISATRTQEKLTGDRYAVRAIELLRYAVAQGYNDVAHLKQDPDLDALRGCADFQKLLAELEAK